MKRETIPETPQLSNKQHDDDNHHHHSNVKETSAISHHAQHDDVVDDFSNDIEAGIATLSNGTEEHVSIMPSSDDKLHTQTLTDRFNHSTQQEQELVPEQAPPTKKDPGPTCTTTTTTTTMNDDDDDDDTNDDSVANPKTRRRISTTTPREATASTVSWEEDDRPPLPPNNTLSRKASLSERVSETIGQQLHVHYSALFGDDYSKREGTFVLVAGVVMAFNMGFTNGCCISGFLIANPAGGVSQIVAGFGGPMGQSSLAVAQHDWSRFGFQSSLMLSYMLGAALAGSFTPTAVPYRIHPTYGPTFLVGGIMLFTASVLAAWEVSDPSYIFFLAACVCGLQNGIASIYSSNLIRCSLTGALTDIALTVGQLTRGNSKSLPKAIVLSLLVFFFWVGGIVAFFMSRKYLSYTLFFNAALFWLIGIACVIFLVKNISISPYDAIFGTWAVKKTLRRLGSLEDRGGAAGEERLKNMFDTIDCDGNGEIDHDQLLQYLMQMDKKTTARAVKMLIRSANKDQNDTIDREAWHRMIQKLYS
uniref:EF-hand domain-containing protein n=1 Tax=Amphora coffeiformis TaxID=265554 RepID=A0A7S3P4L0_9STRA